MLKNKTTSDVSGCEFHAGIKIDLEATNAAFVKACCPGPASLGAAMKLTLRWSLVLDCFVDCH